MAIFTSKLFVYQKVYSILPLKYPKSLKNAIHPYNRFLTVYKPPIWSYLVNPS